MTLWALVVYCAAAVLLVAAMVGVSFVLGERHRERATGDPYESGVAVTGSARVRLSADFYLVGLLFVIFDLEAAFLYAWAVSARTGGWAGYAGLLVFVAILVAGLVYEWRCGALDWGWSEGAKERARTAREASRRLLAARKPGS